MKKIAIVGAGWAGMAAAVSVCKAGHIAIVLEASRTIGGRARALKLIMPDRQEVLLDNGQHILIGAYTQTLALMRQVGVDPDVVLLEQPLSLRFADGGGLALPDWPAPWNALAGMLGAKGWSLADKWSMLRAARQWQSDGFTCDPAQTVAGLCQSVRPRVMADLIEPLCVSALNTPADRASGAVFLRVLKDSLFGGRSASNLLLPRADLAALFPHPAAQWISQHGSEIRLGERATQFEKAGEAWWVDGEAYEAVILACSASNAASTLMEYAQIAPAIIATSMQDWINITQSLQFEAITTVYAHAPGASLPCPMLAMRSGVDEPAQFVFDRGQLNGPKGLLAFAVSASSGDRDALQVQVLAQARHQLGLPLQAVQTVVEKRATFACTPNLERPSMHIAPGLFACGDYVQGPYPATLEGAVRSGVAAATAAMSSP